MFKKAVHVLVLAVLALEWSGCSTSRALVNYDKIDSTVKATPGPVNGKNLGPVRGDEGGAIWAGCTQKATESVQVMLAQAKDLGANEVGDITWRSAKDGKTPSCKKGWGYILIWPFILTPLFMSTAVDGVAYKTDGANHKGFYKIPADKNEQFALAQAIVAGLN